MSTQENDRPDAPGTGSGLDAVELEKLRALSYEEAMASLEQAVARLESGETSLGESMALFRRGIALSEICAGHLASIEKQITQLIERPNGQVEEKPFTEGAG